MFLFEKSYRLLQLAISYKLKLLKPLGPPFQFSIEATNRCNFKCSFCPQSNPNHKNIRPVGELSVDEFRKFLNNIKKLKHGNKHISICLDGEPLMNKSFPELIKIANEEGLVPRFSSNGKLFTPKIVDELSDYKFLASIDFSSEAKVFDEVRGNKGDFEKVLENLKYLVDKAAKNRELIQVEIVDITHFSGEFNAIDSLMKMKELFPKDLPNNIKFWSREFHNFGGHLKNNNEKNNYKLCPYVWASFHVTWDGNVVACGRDTEAKTVLGNVFKDSIMDIWHGEEYVKMRKLFIEQRVEEIEACKNCDMPYSASSVRWQPKYILSSLLRR